MPILLRNEVGHKELGSLCLFLKITHSLEHPLEDVLDSFLFSMNQISLKANRVVRGVTENFQESTDPL
jgi:hypothetical protein